MSTLSFKYLFLSSDCRGFFDPFFFLLLGASHLSNLIIISITYKKASLIPPEGFGGDPISLQDVHGTAKFLEATGLESL